MFFDIVLSAIFSVYKIAFVSLVTPSIVRVTDLRSSPKTALVTFKPSETM